MSKRRANKAEIEYGIGFEEVDEQGIEPEETDEEEFVGFAQEEENEINDDELVEAYFKESVNPEEEA